MNTTYHLLAKKTGGAFGDFSSTRYSLWRGETHLLYVKRQGYAESYKRFFFPDIQAIVTQQTDTARLGGLCHGLALLSWLALLLVGILVSWHPALLITCGICALVAGVLFGVNRYRGPTCATYVFTAVQRERIYPLDRTSTASRMLVELRALISAAQGTPSDTTPTAETDISAFKTAARTPAAATERAVYLEDHPTHPPRTYRSISHRILCVLLLLNVCACYLRFVWPGSHMLVIGILVWSTMLAALVRAFITQARSDLWPSLKVMVWLAAAYLVSHATAAALFATLVGPRTFQPRLTWAALVAASKVVPFESPFVMGILIAGALCSTALGISGNLGLNAFARSRRKAPNPKEAPKP